MQVLVRQSLCFEQEAQSINGMFKIGLGGCFAALLQIEKIVFNLFGIQTGRKAVKVEGYSCNMATIIVECSWTSAEDRNIALEALE